MHIHSMDRWKHNHDYGIHNKKGEQRTRIVLILTAATMVCEIAAGLMYGSMALLADGWHMGTHLAAFLITIFAYQYARKQAKNSRFTFGTGKVNVLGGFASAVALAGVSLVMAIESVQRMIEPQAIQFNESIIVAAIGLTINIISAILLKDNHSHHHHDHDHHHDHNLHAAYLHVLADATTSLLAIAALLVGKYFGWHWLDPVMGIVGAVIIIRWSYGLLKQTSPILLDGSVKSEYTSKVKETIENDSDNRISDIHIWKVGAHDTAAIIAIVTHYPKPVEHYKSLLSGFKELTHITIELHTCRDKPCVSVNQ